MVFAKLERIPLEFAEIVQNQPLIANKNFYIVHELPIKIIQQKDLLKTVFELYKTENPLNDFLLIAMET